MCWNWNCVGLLHQSPSSTPSEPLNSVWNAGKWTDKESGRSGVGKCPSTHFLIQLLNKASSRQVGCSWCQALSLISVLISLNTSPPTIKSSLVPNTAADLCALAQSQPLCLYHTPTSLWQTGLISPAATLHPASKRTAVEKAPQGPLRMDSWIKHAPEASFLSPRSAQALIRHGSRELPTVTSPSFPEQKGTVLRNRSSERGLPPTQSLHIMSTHWERGQQRKIEMRENKKNEAWKIKYTKKERKRKKKIFLGAGCNTWVKPTVYTALSNTTNLHWPDGVW